jgi:DNA-binding NtrC family response regulator
LNRSILLVDDDAEVLGLLGRFFEGHGCVVQRAAEAKAALGWYERERPDLVVLDIGLPGVSGLRFLQALRSLDPDATVIMLAAKAELSSAIEAMRLGAETFLIRPVDLDHLSAAAERACEKAELRRRYRQLAAHDTGEVAAPPPGHSPVAGEVARQIEQLAASPGAVLVTGETGTGKGCVARMLHSLSPRSHHPFVAVSCAGVAPDFLAVEMFGHERGAGGGAGGKKRGLLELAHAGTCFIDRIAELAPELQPRLLEVLDTGRCRRLGGTRDIEVEARVVAASVHDLHGNVREGSFQRKLRERLGTRSLRLPPLREREPHELAELAGRLLLELRRLVGSGPERLTPAACDALARYHWPGNVRQLRNVLERVLLLHPHAAELAPEQLPVEVTGGVGSREDAAGADRSLAEVERLHIARAMTHHGGNRSRAARTLGISRATLYEKLARYGLDEVGRARGAAHPRA